MAPFETRNPQVSETTIALVRGAAHRYVMAGGSIFPTQDDTDAGEHIGNVRAALSTDSDEFDRLLKASGLSHEVREKLWSASVTNASQHADAGFLFGAFVGLEMLASLNGVPATVPTRRPAKKGGPR